MEMVKENHKTGRHRIQDDLNRVMRGLRKAYGESREDIMQGVDKMRTSEVSDLEKEWQWQQEAMYKLIAEGRE